MFQKILNKFKLLLKTIAYGKAFIDILDRWMREDIKIFNDYPNNYKNAFDIVVYTGVLMRIFSYYFLFFIVLWFLFQNWYWIIAVSFDQLYRRGLLNFIKPYIENCVGIFFNFLNNLNDDTKNFVLFWDTPYQITIFKLGKAVGCFFDSIVNGEAYDMYREVMDLMNRPIYDFIAVNLYEILSPMWLRWIEEAEVLEPKYINGYLLLYRCTYYLFFYVFLPSLEFILRLEL